MMDIVIPIRDRPSLYNDVELQYSLRSIDKYFPVRDVWCVGIPREWLSVNWIQTPDMPGKYDGRHESVRQKILSACDNPYVSDPFVLWNDDFFLLRHVSELHDYYDGTIADRIKNTAPGYRKLMESSIPHSDGNNYEVHTPVIIYKDLFKEATRPSALYRNIYCSSSPTEKVEIRDPKLYNKQEHMEFRDWVRDKWMFSASEFSFAFLMKEMGRLYPEKSRWE